MMENIKTDKPILSNREEITQTIAKFWDNISEAWKAIWGQHIHHGYYDKNQTLTPLQAQEKLIIKLADILDIAVNAKILDVGCGMGGSSIYLAKHYNAYVTGITLSPKQVEIATRSAKENNSKNVTFKIEDALHLDSFADNSYDIIWSLESCEQFFDKHAFIKQAYRVLKPGGKLMLATWCSSRDEFNGKPAKKYAALCKAFDLPYMPSITHYRHLLLAEHFSLTLCLDWSNFVKQSWDIGMSLTHAYNFFQLLKMGGWRGLRFAHQIKLMRDAFLQDIVQYGVFLASKPDESRC